MKKVEKTAGGANFAAVTVGKMDELNQHTLILAPGVEIPGKVFAGSALGATGAELSFQRIEPGAGVGFLHPQDARGALHHRQGRRRVSGGRQNLRRRRGQRNPGLPRRPTRAAQHRRRADGHDLRTVQSRFVRIVRRRRRGDPRRRGRVVAARENEEGRS